MEDVCLLDEELNRKHIIDTYSNIIWANRYNELFLLLKIILIK